MKTSKSLKPGKNFETVVSMLAGRDVLNLNQMANVRGGDGTPDPIVIPPNPPDKEQ